MKSPLNEKQLALREKMLSEMSTDELALWIDACERMENWVGLDVVKGSWRLIKAIAVKELEKRA